MTVIFIGNAMYYATSGDTKPTDAVANSVLFEVDTRKIYFYDGDSWEIYDTSNPATGEVNTAANAGTGGYGFYDTKSGTEIQLRNLYSLSNRLSLALNAGSKRVEIDLDQTNCNLENFGGQIITRTKLPSAVMYEDENNNVGEHSIDFGMIMSEPDSPSNGYNRVFTHTDGQLCVKKDSSQIISLEEGGGEFTTASNVGTDGVGVFKTKADADLKFKKINAGSNKITITDDTIDDEVDIDVAQGNLSLGSIGGTVANSQLAQITDKAKLHSSILYSDVDNDLGDHYVDIGDISAPGNPGAGKIRLYADVAASPPILKVKKSDGSIADLEAGAAGEANTASNIGTAGVGIYKTKNVYDLQFKKLNAGSTKITVTDDTGENEVDIDVAQANLDLNSLGGQLINKAKLHSNIVYGDQNNLLGAFYNDIQEIAAPADPGTGIRRLYVDSTSHELSVRTSAGTSVSLEGGGAGTVTGGENVGTGGVGLYKTLSGSLLQFKKVNAGSNKITVAADANDEVDIDVAQANLTLSSIGGSVTDGQLPAEVPLSDEANSFTATQTFSVSSKFDDYYDFKTITAPASPATNYVRLYPKALDANNYGLFIKQLENGSVVEVRIS